MLDNVLAADFVSLRCQVYGRYVSYFQKMFKSSSKEIRHLVRIVSRDARPVTFRNVQYLTTLTGFSPWDYSSRKIQENLPRALVPARDWWRPSLLKKLLPMKGKSDDKERLNKMIDSLCNT